MERSESTGDVRGSDRQGGVKAGYAVILEEDSAAAKKLRNIGEKEKIRRKITAEGGRYDDEQREFFVTASQKGV